MLYVINVCLRSLFRSLKPVASLAIRKELLFAFLPILLTQCKLGDNAIQGDFGSNGTTKSINIESSADGNGSDLANSSLAVSDQIILYAVSRSSSGQFDGNVEVTWSLIGSSGSLLILEGGIRAQFTASSVGPSVIKVTFGNITSEITVNVATPSAAPVISDVTNQTTAKNVSTGAIPFTISDSDSAITCASVTATTNDQTLLPNANVGIAGTAPNCTVTMNPAIGESGVTTVSLTVSDGVNNVTDTFNISVTNSPPTITDVANQAILSNMTLGPIGFSISDVDDSVACASVTATSNNQALVPDANIVIGLTSPTDCYVTITPTAPLTGSATITLTISDGVDSSFDTFDLTVTNSAPTISNVADQFTVMNVGIGSIPVTVSDANDTLACADNLSGASDNQTVLPNANISIGGTAPNCTVSVTPATSQTGSATVTLTVSDGVDNATDAFNFTVTATNAITISNLVASAETPNSFDVSISYTNDDNANAIATLWYCNHSDVDSCDPVATGTPIGMSSDTSTFSVTVPNLIAPNDPEDSLNLAVVVTDADGVTGSPLTGTAQLNLELAVSSPYIYENDIFEGIGDLNNDGFDDIVVTDNTNSNIYVLGGPNLKPIRSVPYRSHSGFVGDTDGDGLDEIFSAFPNYSFGTDNNIGQAFIYSGLDGSTLTTKSSVLSFSFVGLTASHAGDVNNDGFADYMYFDRNDILVMSGLNHTQIGNSGAIGGAFPAGSAGDYDKDGNDDVIIGSPDVGNGEVKILSITPPGTLRIHSGENTGDGFADSVSSAGDWDNDTFPDIVVSAFNYNVGRGKVYVYSGQTGTLLFSLIGKSVNELLGLKVLGNFDFDGDGFVDLAVSNDLNELYIYSSKDESVLLKTTNVFMFWAAGDVNNDDLSDLKLVKGSGDTVLFGRVTNKSIPDLVSTDSDATSISVTMTMYGDANGNASLALWYCDAIALPTCDPEAGSSTPMIKSGQVYSGVASALTSGNPYNLRIVISDIDGVNSQPADISFKTLLGLSQVFTADAGFTLPAGATYVKILIWGAGGGGSQFGEDGSTGADGGSGGYQSISFEAPALAVFAIQVGAGGSCSGAGGVSSLQNGGNGGILEATGDDASGSPNGGVGGTSTGGSGAPGGDGDVSGAGGGGGESSPGAGGGAISKIAWNGGYLYAAGGGGAGGESTGPAGNGGLGCGGAGGAGINGSGGGGGGGYCTSIRPAGYFSFAEEQGTGVTEFNSAESGGAGHGGVKTGDQNPCGPSSNGADGKVIIKY